MKKIPLVAILMLNISCNTLPTDNAIPFILSVDEVRESGSCSGERLVITFLEHAKKQTQSIWKHYVSGTPGVYKIHYSKGSYELHDDECKYTKEVLMHSEQFIKKRLKGGKHYVLEETQNGKVIINEL